MTPDQTQSFVRRMMDRAQTAQHLVGQIKGATIDMVPSINNSTMNWTIKVLAKSESDALRATELAFGAIIGRNKAFIRNAPVAESQHDFEKMVTLHKGYARFSICDEVGERREVESVAGWQYVGPC